MSNGGGRVHGGEWLAVVLSFVYFFCVLAAYYVVRPVREQLSAAVGSTQLPWFYGATFIVTLALSPVFAALISRWPRRIVVPVVYVFFIACLLAFVPMFTHQGLLSPRRSEEHTSELQSLMRISYAVFCLKKKTHHNNDKHKYQKHNRKQVSKTV